MKKLSFAIFSVIFLVAMFSCASLSTEPSGPAWNASPAAMQQIFPDSEFIAQQGRGATRAAAEADASAAIARFFNTELSSRIDILEQSWERNGTAQAISQIETEIFIQAQMQIFGVRHVQDAYFDNRHGEWVTVA